MEGMMSDAKSESDQIATNSSDQNFTDVSHLDKHYRFARAEYDACIGEVGISQGWRVLDAGCGTGVFLPHIARSVGATGSVTAIDHAPENIQVVETLIARSSFPCSVYTKVSGITTLPFEDDSFDCVWCANVSQYLTDSEFDAALESFTRVVRSGGIIAIKEFDLSCWEYPPINVRLFWRLYDALANTGSTEANGVLRSSVMSPWLRKHRIDVTYRKTTLIERWAPWGEDFQQHTSGLLRFLASTAQALNLTDSDKAEWQHINDTVDEIVRSPDFCSREFFVLTVGRNLG